MSQFNNPPPLSFVASRLEGKVVFVTGASSGIGRAAVERFAAEGPCSPAAADPSSTPPRSAASSAARPTATTPPANGALAGLVKCAALGYARQNIRVNAIAPGPTRSEMFDAWMPDDDPGAAMADRTPMNYIADPDDMARAALFLLSDESRWTTGTVLPCEGGRAGS